MPLLNGFASVRRSSRCPTARARSAALWNSGREASSDGRTHRFGSEPDGFSRLLTVFGANRPGYSAEHQRTGLSVSLRTNALTDRHGPSCCAGNCTPFLERAALLVVISFSPVCFAALRFRQRIHGYQ